MPTEIAIGRALPTDAGLMAAIHRSCFARPWDEDAMARFIAGPDTLCLLGTISVSSGRATGGLLIARRAADDAEILTLAVSPLCRRAGLAKTLLHHAADLLCTAGVRQLFLEVDESNVAALALYRSMGAVPVGKRRGYYDDGADAAIFSLALSG